MAQLNFRVKADLVLGGRVCSPVSVKLSELSEVSGLAEPGQRRAATAGDITKFYVAAWVGGGSTEFSLSPVQENGVADVRLSLRAGDVDTVKFAVAFGLATPRCVRCCHLASSFVQVKDLRAMLSEPGRQGRGFTADQACLKLADNFTRNLALLRVLDAGSDLSACAALRLRPSSLLRLDEANHPLAFIATGIYGRAIPNQNGAPLRLVVPWKYGFKYGKSIVKIDFVAKQPRNTWQVMTPHEYGFYANVNPKVDHPRWSQASERVIGAGGALGQRQRTLMFNGYEAQVAPLYAGLDLRRNY